MGRQLRRVAMDFSWPLDKLYEGFLNPHHVAEKCAICDGSGYSPRAKQLSDMWYGNAPFKPEDNGRAPFTPDDAPIRAFAKRNLAHAPEYYGTGAVAETREAFRLMQLMNRRWSHHLNDQDVAALVAGNRLMDFTHAWSKETGWVKKDPPYAPTALEVNNWSVGGFGHDSINQWIIVKARCAREGVSTTCVICNGEGETWPSAEAKKAYDDWKPTEPPAGDGWQMWETVSEGSPISPVFATAEELAAFLTERKWGADDGTSYETWLAFIRGPGWAMSSVSVGGRLMTGVQAVVAMGDGV